MLFTHKESLEDMVIRLLSHGSFEAGELYEQVLTGGKKVSIQALYKALRYLISASVVVKSGKKLSVSQEWANNLASLTKSDNSIPRLAEGESVHYYYKSLVNLDAYWKHLIKSLELRHIDQPVFIYNPYGIWFHIPERQESQTGFISEFENQKHYGYLVIGNDSSFDKNLKKILQNDFLQIDIWNKSQFKPSEYFTIIGDYIITTKLSKKVSSAISLEYQNINNDEDFESGLSKILKIKDGAKVKVVRDSRKAKLLRKKLSKNFFIPKEVKEKFKLF